MTRTITITDPAEVRVPDVATFTSPSGSVTGTVLGIRPFVGGEKDGQPAVFDVGAFAFKHDFSVEFFVSATREVPEVEPGTTGTAWVRTAEFVIDGVRGTWIEDRAEKVGFQAHQPVTIDGSTFDRFSTSVITKFVPDASAPHLVHLVPGDDGLTVAETCETGSTLCGNRVKDTASGDAWAITWSNATCADCLRKELANKVRELDDARDDVEQLREREAALIRTKDADLDVVRDARDAAEARLARVTEQAAAECIGNAFERPDPDPTVRDAARRVVALAAENPGVAYAALMAADEQAPDGVTEPWPFAPGDVVRDSGEGDDAAWLDAAPVGTVVRDKDGDEWLRFVGGWRLLSSKPRPSEVIAGKYGPLTVVSVPYATTALATQDGF